jgi:hypothetical protein
MCAALCISNSARQAILAKCSGVLQLHIESQAQQITYSKAEKAAGLVRVMRQAAWLAQHGRLVGQLQLHFSKLDSAALPELADADELAMQAAMQSLLQLRSLHISAARPASLLNSLRTSSSLTSLHLQDTRHYQCAESPLLAVALSRLAGLRQLIITGQWYTAHDRLPAVLAGLSQLTKLQLQPQLPAGALQCLPSQLVELQLANPDYDAAQLVACVGALQQLQSFTLVYNFSSGGDLVGSHAAAWASIPSLRRLDLDMFDASEWLEDESLYLTSGVAAGIAAATQLMGLYTWFSNGCGVGVDLVRMLSPLQQLQTLELHIPGYARWAGGPLASFGTLFSSSLLQLQNLTLHLGQLRQLAVSQIALQVTQVTQLVLEGAELGIEGLHTIAHGMPHLHRLCFCDDAVGAEDVAAAVEPPLLPALEQLAFVNSNSLWSQEEQASAVHILKQARSVAVIALAQRSLIPSGFVGAYDYSYFP